MTLRTDLETIRDAAARALGELPSEATVRLVRAGENLQAALDAGGAIALERATWHGNFVITKPTTLTTRDAHGTQRLESDGGIGGLVSPGGAPVLTVLSSDVQVSAVGFLGSSNDLIETGPVSRVRYDRVWIAGDPAKGAKRGIKLNGSDVSVTRSRIQNIWRPGQDSQAIAGWDGPGPYLIDNNYLEAASENIMFGGADPLIKGTVASDIVITNNDLTKNLAWRGKGYAVKNLFELKSAKRVTVKNNRFWHSWRDGQDGYAIMLTPTNQDGTHPEGTVEDVTIEGNHISLTAGGVNIGRNPNAQQASRIAFRNNFLDLRNATAWGGPSRVFQLVGGPAGIAIEQNTVLHEATMILMGDGPAVPGFVCTGNLFGFSGIYGLFTNGSAHGRAWREFFPGGVIGENAIADFPIPTNLPGNQHVTAADVAVDADGYALGTLTSYGRRR